MKKDNTNENEYNSWEVTRIKKTFYCRCSDCCDNYDDDENCCTVSCENCKKNCCLNTFYIIFLLFFPPVGIFCIFVFWIELCKKRFSD